MRSPPGDEFVALGARSDAVVQTESDREATPRAHRRARAGLAVAALGLLAAGVAGCLPEVAPAPVPMCETSAECDQAAGEICDEGVCWGNPPAVRLAAQISPPPDRTDLVATEVPTIAIADDGVMAPLVIEAPERLVGRVLVECPDDGSDCDSGVSVAAWVDVERPSRFPGGPVYDPQSVLAAPGIGAGEPAFTVAVPASIPDELYLVTILPDSGSSSGIVYDFRSPAELAPPERFHVEILPGVGSVDISRELGQPAQLKTLVGRVENALGQGLVGVSVEADALTLANRVERVSTLAITDADGSFQLRLPREFDTVDIIATPADPATGPVLRRRDASVAVEGDREPIVALPALRVPPHASPVSFNLPILGADGSGGTIGVASADVELTTELGGGGDDGVTATFTARATTDDQGNAAIALIPAFADASRIYRVRVTPQPNASYGAKLDEEIAIGPAGGWLGQIELPQRVRVSGRLFSDTGEPLVGASVTARTATGFLWSLATAEQVALARIDLPTTIVAADATFVLWLDPLVANGSTGYDLEINPPAGAPLPRWTISDIRIGPEDRVLTGVDLGDHDQPAPAFVRGTIVDALGAPLPGASVTIFALPVDDSVCADRGDLCAPPAVAYGTWTADEHGEIRCVLPRL